MKVVRRTLKPASLLALRLEIEPRSHTPLGVAFYKALMREALKIVATLLLSNERHRFRLWSRSSIVRPSGVGSTLIQEAVMSVLLSGAVWFLADIAQAANRRS